MSNLQYVLLSQTRLKAGHLYSRVDNYQTFYIYHYTQMISRLDDEYVTNAKHLVLCRSNRIYIAHSTFHDFDDSIVLKFHSETVNYTLKLAL